MNLDQTMTRLQELGAPVDEIGADLTLHVDTRGSAHTRPHCHLASGGTTAATYSTEPSKCPCTYSLEQLSVSPLWNAATQLARWDQAVQDTELGVGVLERRRKVRAMQEPFRSVRNSQRSLWNHLPQLADAKENVLAGVGQRYNVLKAEMRTPEARYELLSAAEAAGDSAFDSDGTRMVGIEAYNPLRVQDDLVDAIVLSYWETMVGLGNFPLVLPSLLAGILEQRWDGQWGYLTVALPLTEEDTRDVLETAAKLWDPSSDGEMRELKNALEAARRI